jgi:molecular chaperone DnaK (HSP70)
MKELLGDENHHPLTFVPLIRRNTRLPARFVRTFQKMSEHQASVQVQVYQGEDPNTRHNHYVGQFMVDLTNHDDTGLDIEFQYDINGTIRISLQEHGGTRQTYTMDTAHSAAENSGFKLQSITEVDSAETVDTNPSATNFLIQRVEKQLLELDKNSTLDTDTLIQIRTQLSAYQALVAEQADGDELDELEDALFDWLASFEEALDT